MSPVRLEHPGRFKPIVLGVAGAQVGARGARGAIVGTLGR